MGPAVHGRTHAFRADQGTALGNSVFGELGGAISAGVLGLFLGPVVLAVGYKVIIEWIELHAPSESAEALETKNETSA
jgi:hypothetical protein